MAERIVSPGVFTIEKDLSYLPQGIGEIGAALIGPTIKGPAFVPTVVGSYSDFARIFGGMTENSYLPYTAKHYLENATRATIIRVLGSDGYSLKYPLEVIATGSYGERLISVLHPTYVVTSDDTVSLFNSSSVVDNTSGSFVLTISGSFTTDVSAFTNAISKNGTPFSCSINYNSNAFIGDLFGHTAYGTQPVYNYVDFKFDAQELLSTDPSTTVIIRSGSGAAEWDFTDDYKEASTPWITSQKIGGNAENLFRFHTLAHGVHSNYEFKIGISNIKAAGTVAGSEYGQFDVIVRYVDQSKINGSPFDTDDDDIRPSVVESFTCNLDPNSPLFISRVIGDRYYTVDSTGKVTANGDYTNKSVHVRVEVDNAVSNGALSPEYVPFGFRALWSPVPSAFAQPASASYKTEQKIGGTYNRRVYYGYDYDFASNDNLNYLKPVPIAANRTTGSNADFYLGDYNQAAEANYPTAATAYSGSVNLTTNTSIDTRKFMVPFQGGFDGHKPHLQKKTGTWISATNTQGFDISNSSATGYASYKKALDTISNADEYDVNLIVVPGVLHSLHSGITTYAKDLCEDRGDAFFVMDATAISDNVATAVSTVEAFDSNYAATYFPWVKIMDTDRNKPVWVPPSVVLPGVIAFNDKVAAPWNAPAGFNRGGLSTVIEVKERLTKSDRDTLYENRINPIATFPRNGVVVWGQKTLQGKPSALDRINVRRLLIAAKKYISSVTQYLVFDQNTAQTRNRFMNIVNPYLESIQQRQGLYRFFVKMDEENNTPDVIDRNIMYGQLWLQPTKTAEFIVLDFNVLPTGAAFPEG